MRILTRIASSVKLLVIVSFMAAASNAADQSARLDFELPQGQQFPTGTAGILALSPDGRLIAYSTSKGLYLRSLDDSTTKLIAGTEGGARQPFFSPDGKWIGYLSLADRKLKKSPVDGGAPQTLIDLALNPGSPARWGADNTIVFVRLHLPADIEKAVAQPGAAPSQTQLQQALRELKSEIVRLPADGGTADPILSRTGAMQSPTILRGGKAVLYSVPGSASPEKIVVQAIAGEPRELIAGARPVYLPSGQILYAAANSLFVLPFDPDKLEAAGKRTPVVENVRAQQFSVSDSGTLAYIPYAPGRSRLVWVDREGKETPIDAAENAYSFPKLSPDGTRVALAIQGENTDVWILDLARRNATQLTFEKATDYQPIWTPDGKQVIFWSGRDSEFGGVFRKNADGKGKDRKIVSLPDRQLLPWALSSDGKTLVVVDTPDVYTTGDVGMVSMEGKHTRTLLLQKENIYETQAKLSPDGKWLAYVSNESGALEIYVSPFPDVDKGRWKVSSNGGVSPLWAPDGRELFYFGEGDSSVMAVAVETGQGFTAGTPKKLFARTPYIGGGSTPGTPWDVHPDGKRFLMMKPVPNAGPQKVNVIVNWVQELKRISRK
jgi:serine/threonine-protein kinase